MPILTDSICQVLLNTLNHFRVGDQKLPQSCIHLLNKHSLIVCDVCNMKVMILCSTKSELITSNVLKSLSSPYREGWVKVGSEGRQISQAGLISQ